MAYPGPVLLGVHVPKAGGTSIGAALAQAYQGSFYSDYADDPSLPESQRQLDPQRHFEGYPLPPGYGCIYGHYHIGKYGQEEALRFTLIRHPVEIVLSLYAYWRSVPRGGAPHQYFLKEQLDILGLANMPSVRKMLSQTYFGDFDMGRFDLIGRHDAREASLTRLSQLCGRPLDTTIHANATASDEGRTLREDKDIVAALTDILSEDIRFYERWAYRDV